MAITIMVHVRVDQTVRTQAAATLPFDAHVPNSETIAAIQELEAGHGVRFESVDHLLTDLNADD